MLVPIVLWTTIALAPDGTVLGSYSSPSIIDCVAVQTNAQLQNPGLNVMECQQVLFGGEAPAARPDTAEAP